MCSYIGPPIVILLSTGLDEAQLTKNGVNEKYLDKTSDVCRRMNTVASRKENGPRGGVTYEPAGSPHLVMVLP